MGDQIIKQPNGLFAIYSSVADKFLLLNATRDDIIEEMVEDYRRHASSRVDRIIDDLNAGEKPYYQFTKTWEEACSRIAEVHGTLELERMLGLMDEDES